VDLIASIAEPLRDTLVFATEVGGATEEAGFQINLFWVVAQAVSFLLFLAILYFAAFKRIGGVLEERRSAIEQGLRDAEQARHDREGAEAERIATLNEARREANEILTRSQKVAQESREADIAATREELERLRTRATAEIEAEKQRAMTELRAEVADLALSAASRVVGESMTDTRQRRLVEEFLTESASGTGQER
jgi:F-type H+-transporting ATPase subunit b